MLGALNRRLLRFAGRTKTRASPTSSWFEESPLGLATWNLFDLGVVDVNQDGNLGVFTTNHNSRQSLLVNRGGGAFSDGLDDLGLNHDVAFPGWDDDVTQPGFDREGLYLYRDRYSIVVERTGAHAAPVSVELSFLSPVGFEHGPSVEVEVVRRGGTESAATVVRCALGSPARLDISPGLVGAPIKVSIDRRLALHEVFVGSTMVSPGSHQFTLHLRDRHGVAWADFDGDGHLEAFVARGGLKGRLEQFQGAVDDELLVRRGGRFGDRWAEFGIRKGGCRARQASWVDVVGGGPPWLFVSCMKSTPRLYRRHSDGSFADASEEMGMNQVRGTTFAWLDADGNGRPALLAAGDDKLTVYRRHDDGPFARSQVVGLRSRGAPVAKLAAADYRGLGRPDVFAPSRAGNTLLLNEGGSYRAVDPRSVGLPGEGGVTAHWVDYDSDGLVDLQVLPGGLFRQVEGGRFRATRLLDDELPSPIYDVRAAWFDADNGGTRDFLVAVSGEEKVRGGNFGWRSMFFRNVGAAGHWLQVELTGPGTNPQAIGSAVTVRAGDRAITQWVGCNEGSHYSQGHYRMYFGLGDHRAASSLRVRWPDGSSGEFGPAGDEVVRIAYVQPGQGRTTGVPA